MHDAFILAQSGSAWSERLAQWLGDAGLSAQCVTAAEVDVVLAAAVPRLIVAAPDVVATCLLQRARRDGVLLVCVGQAQGDFCDDALAEPVTEEAVFRLLARHGYLAISGTERAGLADAIARQSFGDPALAAELVQALATSTESDLERLQAEGDSLESLRSVAHRVKASAQLADCKGFHRLAQRLENAARSGDAALASAVAAIFTPTTREFHAMLVGGAGE
jgi:HPt (histidine-containing phosphotransfer) domain-containing protein